MTSLPRLFADFNNADALGRIRLNTVGAKNDMLKQNIVLHGGMEVFLDDGEEISTVGVAVFSKEEDIWVVRIDWNNLQYRQ